MTLIPTPKAPRSPWAIFWPIVIRRSVMLAMTVGAYAAIEQMAAIAA